MNLSELYYSNKNKYPTDKNTRHSYIDHFYSNFFVNKEFFNILEIGVYGGASLILWHDYFTESTIYGLDNRRCNNVENYDRIKFIHKNAYTQDALSSIPSNLDLIIDDGPHTFNSMVFVIKNYLSKLNNNGILIIEDIQSYDWFAPLIQLIPEEIFSHQIVDLRTIKNRYDDMLLVIAKR